MESGSCRSGHILSGSPVKAATRTGAVCGNCEDNIWRSGARAAEVENAVPHRGGHVGSRLSVRIQHKPSDGGTVRIGRHHGSRKGRRFRGADALHGNAGERSYAGAATGVECLYLRELNAIMLSCGVKRAAVLVTVIRMCVTVRPAKSTVNGWLLSCRSVYAATVT